MKFFLKRLFRNYIIKSTQRGYKKFYKTCFVKIVCFGKPVSTPLPEAVERAWLERFRNLDPSIDVSALRIFSHYIDNPDHIFPYETFQSFVMPAINERRFDTFYDDKNNLDIFLKKGICCQTILRKIEGVYKDENFAVISDLSIDKVYSTFEPYSVLIVKPSYRTSGGTSVIKLEKVNGCWMVGDQELSLSFLDTYNDNFIIQVLLEQSETMSQFCSSSVNTLRMITYRSVLDNKIEVVASILRIGHEGSLTDNISGGGKAVCVNNEGIVGTNLFDYYGNISHEINSIDFNNSSFKIPNYSNVLDFAKNVAAAYPHHHLLAMDIALDKTNSPKIIEVNVNGFSLDVPYFAQIDLFKEHSDEILMFAMKYRNKILGNITF